MLVLLWANTRILTVRVYQQPAKPTVPSAYYIFHGIAVALEEARIGQLDLALYREYTSRGDVFAEYPGRSSGTPQLVDYYALDVGYGFVVELGRLLFPVLPDDYLRVLALQLAFDFLSIAAVWFLFSRWCAPLGLVAACAYVANAVFVRLVSVPLYYYWDVPIGFAVLGGLLMALEDDRRASEPALRAGAVLGLAVWVRASWWPLSAVFFLTCAASRELRRKLVPALAIFVFLAAPQVARSSLARGTLTLSTRATWHVALVGLGYYPNRYGFELSDESVFRRIHDKYGVVIRTEDYGSHDEAARREYLEVLRGDPGFVARFVLRPPPRIGSGYDSHERSGLPGSAEPALSTAVRAGLIAMHRRGGARRTVGWAAAALFATYVGLTSLFYFVGLAYDNVSEVSLLVLLMGLLEAAGCALTRARGEFGGPTPS